MEFNASHDTLRPSRSVRGTIRGDDEPESRGREVSGVRSFDAMESGRCCRRVDPCDERKCRRAVSRLVHSAGRRRREEPLASVQGASARGKTIYVAQCARCHGPDGQGNGPDSDHAADLTDDLRSSINPEGVLFYKIWNGHAVQLRTQVDDMPPFRDKLSRDQVWAIVEYLKVLRTSRP